MVGSFWTLVREGRDGMGLIAEYRIRYHVPIASGLDNCFDPLSRKERAQFVIFLH